MYASILFSILIPLLAWAIFLQTQIMKYFLSFWSNASFSIFFSLSATHLVHGLSCFVLFCTIWICNFSSSVMILLRAMVSSYPLYTQMYVNIFRILLWHLKLPMILTPCPFSRLLTHHSLIYTLSFNLCLVNIWCIWKVIVLSIVVK